MYVTDVTISGTEYHPGETMEVTARIQKDYWDLGDYALATYIKKKTASTYAWERVGTNAGSIGLGAGNASIGMPSFTVPGAPGEYYVGVLDEGNIGSDRGATVDEVLRSTNAIRLFAVTIPPPTGKAQINIYTYPNDADIYIDGVKAGTGSIIGYNVNPGIYQITAKKFLHEDATQMITATPGQVIPVELHLKSMLSSENLTTIALYAGAGILVVGGAYILINRKARSRATAAGKRAWETGKDIGSKAYGAAGRIYDEAGNLYVKVRDA